MYSGTGCRFPITCSRAYHMTIAPTAAGADIGVPMLFVTLPAMVIALVPVIWIEAQYGLQRLGLPRRQALGVSTAANVVSTIIGLPLTWLVLVSLQMVTGGGSAHGLRTLSTKLLAVTWQSPWLIPYDDDLVWMVPAAALCLLVPFFFASVYIEYQVARRMLSTHARAQVRAVVWRANLLSYGLLAVAAIVWLLRGLHAKGAA
jgi:hypothetical protein